MLNLRWCKSVVIIVVLHCSVLPVSPPRHVSMSAPHPLVTTVVHTQPNVDDSQLADTIHSIASPDLNVSIYQHQIYN